MHVILIVAFGIYLSKKINICVKLAGYYFKIEDDKIEIMKEYGSILKNQLSLELGPVSFREIFGMPYIPCDLFSMRKGQLQVVLAQGMAYSIAQTKELVDSGITTLYAFEKERLKLIEHHQEELRRQTRSLSIGDPLENGKKQMNLMTLHLQYLYENPASDDLLKLQIQAAQNSARFLLDNSQIYFELYESFLKQRHYYIFSQPLLSSLFLLGLLKYSKQYSDKEIESLFLTSYLKDIGMSMIPAQKYLADTLTEQDKDLLAKHATYSTTILRGRMTLGASYFAIIENHHAFSLLNNGFRRAPELSNKDYILGFETLAICLMDIVGAMISVRPYREATSLFDALELIRVIIGDQFPQEFKLIVHYFKQLFHK